ncbi:MAG: AMP-binding protein, partial [Pseudomonadota bacterium]
MTVQDLPMRTRQRVKRSHKNRNTRYGTPVQQQPADGGPATVGLPGTSGVRWSKGERLEDLFESLCDRLAETGEDASPAVIAEGVEYSFRDLDNRANQAARHLQQKGIKPGDRVALLLDKSFDTYVVLLAVQKLHAAYVPLDQ